MKNLKTAIRFDESTILELVNNAHIWKINGHHIHLSVKYINIDAAVYRSVIAQDESSYCLLDNHFEVLVSLSEMSYEALKKMEIPFVLNKVELRDLYAAPIATKNPHVWQVFVSGSARLYITDDCIAPKPRSIFSEAGIMNMIGKHVWDYKDSDDALVVASGEKEREDIINRLRYLGATNPEDVYVQWSKSGIALG